jgi:hypothetical protein
MALQPRRQHSSKTGCSRTGLREGHLDLRNLISSSDIVRVIYHFKTNEIGEACSTHGRKNILKCLLKKQKKAADLIHLALNRDKQWALVNMTMNSLFHNKREYLH